MIKRCVDIRQDLRKDKTGELDDGGEGEGVGEDDGPDLMIRADKVQGHESQPVNGVDAVGEENESRLIEPSRALSCFESIQCSRNYQQEWEE